MYYFILSAVHKAFAKLGKCVYCEIQISFLWKKYVCYLKKNTLLLTMARLESLTYNEIEK